MNSLTLIVIFVSVCAATVLTTGLSVVLGAHLIARSIRQYARATEANNDAVNRFLSIKQAELKKAFMDSVKSGASVHSLFPQDDDKGPKGSA